MITAQDLFAHNRVTLPHFDSYSTALLFPRWNHNTLLLRVVFNLIVGAGGG